MLWMMSRVQRRRSTAPLAILLAVIAGVACFLWQAHDLGRSCGYGPRSGLPTFPVVTALIVLVACPTVIVGVSAVLVERRRPSTVAVLMTLAAVASAVAFVIALFVFWSSRGCFK